MMRDFFAKTGACTFDRCGTDGKRRAKIAEAASFSNEYSDGCRCRTKSKNTSKWLQKTL